MIKINADNTLDILKQKFSEDNIKQFYLEHNFSSAPGIDRINKRIFDRKLTQYVKSIHKKVLNETYKFSPYKESLILKNREQLPRVISIPTIRDKLTLRILRTLIQDVFSPEVQHRMIQPIVEEIKQCISQYNYVIKLDIKDYYPSINHKILFAQINKKIKSRKVLKLIRGAITTPTVLDKCKSKECKKNKRGIPQGLPISNILSSIYLIQMDKKFSQLNNLKYFRFVDDILILCRADNYQQIKEDILNEIKSNYSLKVNAKKTEAHEITKEFSYLGYSFKGPIVSVREKSKRKLENSLENLFIDYKNSGFKRTSFFLWKLNLRITGCISDNKKYGWVFFFSQITQLSILFHFDWIIKKLIKRFELETKLDGKKIKRFVRTYHEMINNLNETGYIPNFDNFLLVDKEKFLKEMEVELPEWNEVNITHAFKCIVFSSVRELERDIQNLRDRY
ncbi:RNA-directed DNA polymerase (Reverse transcriptase) [Pelosinus fermentans JBW45]|uniref:RNA-directed DNA polymerase (Reverse transcriptase) n=1 Tax=Pelosinus fermentans JBW45 TaxID=1192197 RepID=I8TW64_9FIRM|nr:RNA-directed DNA polymerase (Reverse transcriptase) [Pelosinus fermentans JBW45]